MPQPPSLLTSRTAPRSAARTIRGTDGRRWRVNAVRPDDVLGERRHAASRRLTPVESLEDPPVLQRRATDDRRTRHEPRHAMPGALLPDAWRHGWLLFETDGTAAREVRRYAPLPQGWDGLTDAELGRYLARAVVRGG